MSGIFKEVDDHTLDIALKLLKLASLGGRVKACDYSPSVGRAIDKGWLKRSEEDPCWLYITVKGVEKVLSMKQ